MTGRRTLGDRAVEIESTSTEARVIEATVACVSRGGIAKTTLDEIAAEAGLSRATVYRAFPGGKGVVLAATVRHELAVFLNALSDDLDDADCLEDLLVTGITSVARSIGRHPALVYLLQHEPDLVLTHFAFHRLDPVLAVATRFAAPKLERFVPPAAARAGAEWLVRIILSYALSPSERVDLSDEVSTRRFATTFLVPGLVAGHATTIPTRSHQ